VAASAAATASLLPDLEPRSAIGVAGTVTTLAAIDLGLTDYDPEKIHGHRLSREAVHELRNRLAATPLEKRRRMQGLEPERAAVIVAGAAIVAAILDRYHLDELEASERDILHGAALEAAELPAAEPGAAPPGAYT